MYRILRDIRWGLAIIIEIQIRLLGLNGRYHRVALQEVV